MLIISHQEILKKGKGWAKDIYLSLNDYLVYFSRSICILEFKMKMGKLEERQLKSHICNDIVDFKDIP